MLARQRSLARRRWLSLFLACVILSGGVLYAAVHSPLLSARRVVLKGALHTTRSQVLSATGLGSHPPLVDFSPSRAERALDRLPWVASATVRRRWPDSVLVRLDERKAVAVAVGAEGSEDAILDGTGRVLALTNVAPKGLVVVVGASGGAVGSWLGSKARWAAQVAGALPGPLAASSSVVLAGGGVSLRLADGAVVLLGGPGELGQKMVSLETMLTKVKALSGGETLDLTVPRYPTLTPPRSGA